MERGAVLGALFIVALFVVVILGALAVLVWLLARLFIDRRDALRYRTLIKEHEQSKSKAPAKTQVGGWQLTYQDGKKIKTITVPGNTEGEAIKNAMIIGEIRYDRIVSLTKA